MGENMELPLFRKKEFYLYVKEDKRGLITFVSDDAYYLSSSKV